MRTSTGNRASRPPERPRGIRSVPTMQRVETMTAMTEPAPRRRRGLKWAAILVVAALVLWVGYWFAARQVAVMAFDRAFASLAADATRPRLRRERAQAASRSASISTAAISPSTTGEANAAVTAARVTATAPLYRPGRVEAAIAGPVTIEAPDQRRVAPRVVGDAVATVNAGFGGLNRATVALDQVEIVPGAGKNRMPFTRASADHATHLGASRLRRRLPLHGRRHRARPPAEERGTNCRRWRSTPTSRRSMSAARSAPIRAARCRLARAAAASSRSTG